VEGIRSEYENEIAAKLKISPNRVTKAELETVAEENPALKDALRRSRWRRNLEIVVNTVTMVAVLALAMHFGPIIATTLMGGASAMAAAGAIGIGIKLAVTGSIGFLGYMACETGLNALGETALNLREPELREVHQQPYLQHELSLPGQVRYLEQLQTRRAPISEAQIFTVLVTAKPELAAQIQSYYGIAFGELSAMSQKEAMERFGQAYDIAGLTQDINKRLVRAQELAFIAYDQSSGVPKLELPSKNSLEKVYSEVGKFTEQVKEKASAATVAALDKGKNIVAATRDKLKAPFAKSDVSMVVPDHQRIANLAVERAEQAQVARAVS
jgi:hypothetical protein